MKIHFDAQGEGEFGPGWSECGKDFEVFLRMETLPDWAWKSHEFKKTYFKQRVTCEACKQTKAYKESKL